MVEPCFFCGEPSTLLCDFALALVIGGEVNGQPVTTMEAMLSGSYTCDAPMCRACGKMVGHVCAGKHSDTIDRCPLHASLPAEIAQPMTLDQIAKVRRALHATFRRQRVRDDMSLREQVEYWKERAMAAEESIPTTPTTGEGA